MRGKTKLIRRVEQGEAALELLARVVDIYNKHVREGTDGYYACFFCDHPHPIHSTQCVYRQAVRLFAEIFDEGTDELFEWAASRLEEEE